MSWQQFVGSIPATQGEIAKAAGVTPPTVSRWLSGQQGVDAVTAARVARAYGKPVLEAFVAAGFLTEAEAKVRPTAAPDLSQLSNKRLLELVEDRMREEGELGGDTAANTPTGDVPGIGPEGRTRGTPATPVTRAARKGSVKK